MEFLRVIFRLPGLVTLFWQTPAQAICSAIILFALAVSPLGFYVQYEFFTWAGLCQGGDCNLRYFEEFFEETITLWQASCFVIFCVTWGALSIFIWVLLFLFIIRIIFLSLVGFFNLVRRS
jgi:hypothetical protein